MKTRPCTTGRGERRSTPARFHRIHLFRVLPPRRLSVQQAAVILPDNIHRPGIRPQRRAEQGTFPFLGQSVSLLHSHPTGCPLSGSGSSPMGALIQRLLSINLMFSVPGHALSVRPAACNEERVDGRSRGRRIVTLTAGGSRERGVLELRQVSWQPEVLVPRRLGLLHVLAA